MSNLPIVANAPQASVAPTQAAPASENNNPQGQPFGDVLARQVQVADATTSGDKPQIKKTGAKTADEIFADIKVNADAALAPPAPSNLPADMLAALLPQNMLTATPVAIPADTAQNQTAALLDAAGASNATGTAKQVMDTTQVTVAASLSKQANAAQTAVASGAPKQATDIAQAELATQTTVATGVSKQILDTTKSKPALVASSAPKQTDLTTIEKTDLTVSPSSPLAAHTNLAAQADTKKDATFTAMLDKMTATLTDKLAANDEKIAAGASAAQPNVATPPPVAVAATPPTQANVMPVQITLNTPVTHDKWGDEFNQKITWMATNKEQSAELHLNPPQLGPMDVVIKVSGDQATALFTSPHAAVRDAIEQALPKLREMMADNGIMLGNASVNDQAPRNGQDSSGNNRAPRTAPGIGGVTDVSATGSLSARVSPISRHNGIVDTFA